MNKHASIEVGTYGEHVEVDVLVDVEVELLALVDVEVVDDVLVDVEVVVVQTAVVYSKPHGYAPTLHAVTSWKQPTTPCGHSVFKHDSIQSDCCSFGGEMYAPHFKRHFIAGVGLSGGQHFSNGSIRFDQS